VPALIGRVFAGILLSLACSVTLFEILAAADWPDYLGSVLLEAAVVAPALIFWAVIARVLSDESAILSTSPLASYRSDAIRVYVLVAIVASMVTTSVLTVLALTVGQDVDYVDYVPLVAVALVAGLLAGTIFGLAAGQAQVAFQLATAFSAGRRLLPIRLMNFLEQAHRLGLLRVVGSAYQFRHAELQDHLSAVRRR
jgi:hypothetical protein